MMAAPLAALDLPLKILVWEDDESAVWMSYLDPAWLAARHGLTGPLAATVVGARKAGVRGDGLTLEPAGRLRALFRVVLRRARSRLRRLRHQQGPPGRRARTSTAGSAAASTRELRPAGLPRLHLLRLLRRRAAVSQGTFGGATGGRLPEHRAR